MATAKPTPVALSPHVPHPVAGRDVLRVLRDQPHAEPSRSPKPLRARDFLALLGKPSLGGVLIVWAVAAAAWAAVLLA
jgi:hypothetical protein